MAVARKKTTTVKVAPVEQVIVEEPKKAKEEVVSKQKKVFQQNDGIKTTSVTTGQLIMIGIKSGIPYIWMDYGDENEVEYGDLVAAIRASKNHIYKPYIIIDDDDFLESYPHVAKIYDGIPDDLMEVFNLSNDKFKKAISSFPDGVKESIKSMAAKLITEKKLDSVSKIKILDEVFGTELALLTSI